MATTGRDYYEVLGVPRTAPEADIKRAPAAGARAAPGRLGRAGRGHAVQGSRRGVRGARSRRRASSTTASAMPGCAAEAFGRRVRLREPGGHLLGVLRRRRLRCRNGCAQSPGSGHRCRDRDLARGSRDGDHAGRPRAGCDPCGVRRRRRPAGNLRVDLPGLRRHWSHPAHLPTAFGEFIRSQACPRCKGTGRSSSIRVKRAAAQGASSRSEASTSRCRPASTTASGSASRREGHAGRSAASRATCTSSCASVLTSALSAKATTSTRRSISR